VKLVSAVPIDEGQRARLRAIVPELEIVESKSYTDAGMGDLLDASTMALYAFRVPEDLMERAPNLQWLQLLGAGCEHLHGNPVMDGRVRITTASGVQSSPIAEYVLGVILGHYRWLPQSTRAQLKRDWLDQAAVMRGARELRRRTVGVVGYGSIGREVARLAKPFGTRVFALKRDPSKKADSGYTVEGTGDPDGSIPERFYGPDEFLSMLPECDVVVLAMPVTPETEGMMNAEAFAAMKARSFLVNVARGNVLDESALMDALRDGPMEGAALDVFDQEPLPEDSPLWDIENLVVTAHISGASRAQLRRCFELVEQNLQRFVADEPMINPVDPALGY